MEVEQEVASQRKESKSNCFSFLFLLCSPPFLPRSSSQLLLAYFILPNVSLCKGNLQVKMEFKNKVLCDLWFAHCLWSWCVQDLHHYDAHATNQVNPLLALPPLFSPPPFFCFSTPIIIRLQFVCPLKSMVLAHPTSSLGREGKKRRRSTNNTKIYMVRPWNDLSCALYANPSLLPIRCSSCVSAWLVMSSTNMWD